jgi:hypothetical protein
MARSELRSNQKFKRLVHKLNLPAPYVVGLLECMWQCGYSSGNTLLGDAHDVEIAAEWPGNQGELSAILESEKWIDKRDGAYHIHDLIDHAPDYVKKRMRNRAKAAADDQTASNGRKTASNGCQTASIGCHGKAKNDETATVPNTPNPTQPIPQGAEADKSQAGGVDAADNTASDVTFDDVTRAAIGAFDRWSEQNRGYPLKTHANEQRPVLEFLKGLADRPPIVRSDSAQIAQVAFVPQAVDFLAVQKATKFTSPKYAVKCVEGLLNDWARDGPPGTKSKATPTKEWKAKPYCPG